MRPVLLLWLLLLTSSAGATEQGLHAGRLSAQVSLDPWQLRFVDRERGEVLAEYGAAGPQPSGPLGFRTQAGWAHAVRAVSVTRSWSSLSLLLETSDPDGRRLRVELARVGPGEIAVTVGLEHGSAPAVKALGVGWRAPEGERYFGFGEHSTGVDFRGQTLESWSGEGPFQRDEWPFADALVPPAGSRAENTRKRSFSGAGRSPMPSGTPTTSRLHASARSVPRRK